MHLWPAKSRTQLQKNVIEQEVLLMDTNNKIKLVVFDWAGTTVDYGSSAPSEVFDRVFSAAGLHLTKEEINRPMGLKRKPTSGNCSPANPAATSGRASTAAPGMRRMWMPCTGNLRTPCTRWWPNAAIPWKALWKR